MTNLTYASSATSSTTPLDSITVPIPELRNVFGDRLITANDAVYDDARTVFYGDIDRRPALIIRARNAAEVAQAVALARDSGLELAVRSGGHSLAGHGVSDGGIVLDLSNMKAIEFDVAHRTAWAETGLTAGEYTTAAGALGLATGFGDAGSVGIGGITLGGGIGYLVRKHGLTIDDVLAAEVVTADGQLLHVDAATHPDLFWAIRGGGGNFGVVTRFQFRLHAVDTILGGMLMLPATPDVIASFVAAAESAPEELSAIAKVMVVPPMPAFPASAHGKIVIMAMMVYAGDIAAGERAIAPFRSLAKPIADTVKPMRYPEIYPPDQGMHPIASVRTMFANTIDRGVAQTIIDHLQTSTAQIAATEIRVLGGAVARVSADATTFAHRGARILMNVAAMYRNAGDAPAHERWVEEFAAALRQGEGGAYVGFIGDEGSARVRDAYPEPTWERLVAIKKVYDPDNLFRLNQNIPPR
jgi:FAD/FMN-containing dehydrogenase